MTDDQLAKLRALLERASKHQCELSKNWPNPMGDGGWFSNGASVALEAVLLALDGDFTELERLGR